MRKQYWEVTYVNPVLKSLKEPTTATEHIKLSMFQFRYTILSHRHKYKQMLDNHPAVIRNSEMRN